MALRPTQSARLLKITKDCKVVVVVVVTVAVVVVVEVDMVVVLVVLIEVAAIVVVVGIVVVAAAVVAEVEVVAVVVVVCSLGWEVTLSVDDKGSVLLGKDSKDEQLYRLKSGLGGHVVHGRQR
ncbi:hypothetical protein ElyMa_006673500 [Elysia marginata]|uniref:Uncharacterized protein n=1 Tax=Elysia marginata TaxID=1093978 RepID=A0AAV4ILU2_9GAST|nr:hypothetical protein ElyMa_006673500 [Elysia marginata]